MGKNHRKSEVRGPASANAATKRKFISKNKSKSQIKAVNDAVTKGLQGVSIFDQLNDSNQRGQTKSLMALSAVSFTEEMPIDMFYDPSKCSTSCFLIPCSAVLRNFAESHGAGQSASTSSQPHGNGRPSQLVRTGPFDR